jgi:hypothetical protein
LYGLHIAYHPKDESFQLVRNQNFIWVGAVQTGCFGQPNRISKATISVRDIAQPRVKKIREGGGRNG